MKLTNIILSTLFATNPVVIEADFDHDNDIDKIEVIIKNNEANLFYYENLGNDTYKEKKLIHSLPTTGNIGCVAADYNNDTHNDIMISTGNNKHHKQNEIVLSSTSTVYIIKGDGKGNFSGFDEKKYDC